MQVLDPHLDFDDFARKAAVARARVLMLDYDGTLAPFRRLPHLATPYAQVPQMLDRLMREPHTRVVIVSGRRAAEIMPLLRLARQPEIWGTHGWERLSPDGRLCVRSVDGAATRLLQEAQERAEGATRFGARVERKPASVALHWRGLPLPRKLKARAWIIGAWDPLIGEDGLDILPFSGGLEALAPGGRKGHVVRTVLGETPPDSVIAYLGDDHTDEEAFRAMRPRGLPVLVRSQLRDTCAAVWIRPPDELRRFFALWLCKDTP